ATERTVHRLHWAKESRTTRSSSSLRWLQDFFRGLSEMGRIGVWVACGVLIALLALYTARLLRAQTIQSRGGRADSPSHVRDLDIRPESLPADIAGAAWSLWERGDPRGALALLYRGLLSRLVHVYEVPIRESSTEAETLQLASPALGGDAREYAARLIRVWQ